MTIRFKPRCFILDKPRLRNPASFRRLNICTRHFAFNVFFIIQVVLLRCPSNKVILQKEINEQCKNNDTLDYGGIIWYNFLATSFLFSNVLRQAIAPINLCTLQRELICCLESQCNKILQQRKKNYFSWKLKWCSKNKNIIANLMWKGCSFNCSIARLLNWEVPVEEFGTMNTIFIRNPQDLTIPFQIFFH